MRYCEYNNDFYSNSLLIDSEGIRDLDKIEKFVCNRKNKKIY